MDLQSNFYFHLEVESTRENCIADLQMLGIPRHRLIILHQQIPGRSSAFEKHRNFFLISDELTILAV
jgi:hypothetical protein